jgi:hypothetical protein
VSGESFAEKKRRLTSDIARQRGELATAYRGLSKPIQYGEQGLRAFGFLRSNAWLFSILPAAFSVTTSVLAIIRHFTGGKAEPIRKGWFKRGAESRSKREAKREAEGLFGHFKKWGGHGWKAFNLYRRVRKYFP